MRKIPEVISSEPLKVTVPQAWAQLTPRQFKTLCMLFACELPEESFDPLLFLKLSGIDFIGQPEDGKALVKFGKKFYLINNDLLGVGLGYLDWVHEVAPLRDLQNLVACVHKSARDIRLEKFSFAEFIAADSFYSGYVETHKPELAERLVRILFPKIRKIMPWNVPDAVIWFSAVKRYLVQRFPDLYAEQDRTDLFSTVKASPAAVREQVDAMVRALTKGDITMEERVLQAPLYRALTELNQLAKEYRELKDMKC